MNNQKLLTAKYTISGMDCAGCVNTVETFCNKFHNKVLIIKKYFIIVNIFDFISFVINIIFVNNINLYLFKYLSC